MWNKIKPDIFVKGLLPAAALFLLLGCAGPPAEKTPHPHRPRQVRSLPAMPPAVKKPPARFMEDEKIRRAKHRYVPKEVWDVEGSPDRKSELKYLKLASEREPKNPEPLFLLGFVLMEDRKTKQAKEAFVKVLRIKPGHSDAAGNLARIYLEENNHTKALIVANAGLKRNPGDVYLLKTKGDALSRTNKRKAEAFYRKALKTNDSPLLKTGLAGLLYRKNPKNTESTSLLKDCISRFPLYPDAYLLLAEIRYEQGYGAEALKILDNQLRQDPTFIESYRLAGEIALEYGFLEEARNYLQKARSLPYLSDEPEEMTLLWARIHISSGNTDKAREILGSLLSTDMSAEGNLWLCLLSDSIHGRIRGSEKTGDSDVVFLRDYVRARNAKPPAKGALAMEKLGNLPRDRIIFPRFRIFLESARLYLMEGNRQKAIKLIEKARQDARFEEKSAVGRLIEKDYLLKELKEVQK